MTIPGNTAAQIIYPQSRRGDFLWVLPFYDVDPVTKVRTAKDLTGYLFFFRVLAADQVTEVITADIGDGLAVVDNTVRITVDLEQWEAEDLLAGCQYKMQLDMVTPTGFLKPLVEAKLTLT